MGRHDDYLVMMPGNFGCWCFCGSPLTRTTHLKHYNKKGRLDGNTAGRRCCQNHKFQPWTAEGARRRIALTRTSTLCIPVQSNDSGRRKKAEWIQSRVPSTGGPGPRPTHGRGAHVGCWAVICLLLSSSTSSVIGCRSCSISCQARKLPPKPQLYLTHPHKCQACVRIVMEIKLFY